MYVNKPCPVCQKPTIGRPHKQTVKTASGVVVRFTCMRRSSKRPVRVS